MAKLPRTQVASKVGGATLAGSVSLVFVWLLQSKGYVIPGEVQAAITVIFAGAGGWIASSE